ncbi:MAG: hypothetical protein ACPG5T_04415, partial [Endozoicomonas sp.]
MASGMNGLGGSSLINALDLAGNAPVSSDQLGNLKGVKVAPMELPPTPGLKKGDAVSQEFQAEPSKKTLAMRTVKKADKGLVASIKDKAVKVRQFGRSALKTIKHGWGMLKRLVLKENFKTIPPGALGKASEDAKQVIEPMRQQFNSKLGELDSLKREMVGLIDDMQAFEDLYGDTLDVLDDRSKLLNAKGAVTLPVPGESGGVEYVQISAPKRGNAAARERAIDALLERFEASDKYQNYFQSDERTADIQEQRDGLKEDLKMLRGDMLEAFSADLDKRIEGEHTETKMESDKTASKDKDRIKGEISDVREIQSKNVANQEEIVSDARGKLESFDREEKSMKMAVELLKKNISNVEKEISENSKSFKFAVGGIKETIRREVEAAKKNLERLKNELQGAKKALGELPS